MLAAQGLIEQSDAEQIVAELGRIRREIEAGTFRFRPELEDIHMNIEQALIDRLGDVGRKLHTGPQPQRPGVDRPAALDPRRDRPIDGRLLRTAAGVRRPLRARRAASSCRATRTCSGPSRCWPPTTGWPTARSSSATASGSPIAAAARTCCRWARPRWPARRCPSTATHVAERLGFDGVAANSLDASSDRDFVLEFAFALAHDRRAPEHVGRGVDSLVDRASSASCSCRRRFAPARRSCRRRSTPTCWS